jgi:hypothetical protein
VLDVLTNRRPAPRAPTHLPPGIRKACDVWYRALTNYFTPVADFYEARRSTVKAAEDLYPDSPQAAKAVDAAWDIVGAPNTSEGFWPKCDPTFAIDAASCPVV